MYQIRHSGEGKIIEVSPHQIVIKDLKGPKHVLAIGIVDNLLGCTNLTALGHHLFHQF
jgi:hypothetical protein